MGRAALGIDSRFPKRVWRDPPAASGLSLPTADEADAGRAGASQAPRVAVCSVGELFGGVERHILGVSHAFATRGLSVSLFLFHDGELANRARAQGIDTHILPSHNRSLVATARQLARLLEQRRIDVVHAHGYKATVYCALARRRYRFGLVKTEHGLPETTGGWHPHALRGHVYTAVDRVATRMAGAMVCYVTEDLQARCRRMHAGLRTCVVRNGIERLDRRQSIRPIEYRADAFNLAIVGRLEAVKGQQVAIDAIATASMPADVHLHIVGDGPTGPALRALAAARGVADRVHFPGFRSNVYDYIARCDALLMPSLHEGLPYVLLEAMALAVPVVASGVGGIAEVMRDETTALLVSPRDPVALTRAIVRLHDDPALRARLGRRAQGLQRSLFSLEAMAGRYVEIYQEVLGGRG